MKLSELTPIDLLGSGPELGEMKNTEHVESLDSDLTELILRHGLLHTVIALGPVVGRLLDGCAMLRELQALAGIEGPTAPSMTEWKAVSIDAYAALAKLQEVIRRGIESGALRPPRQPGGDAANAN